MSNELEAKLAAARKRAEPSSGSFRRPPDPPTQQPQQQPQRSVPARPPPPAPTPARPPPHVPIRLPPASTESSSSSASVRRPRPPAPSLATKTSSNGSGGAPEYAKDRRPILAPPPPPPPPPTAPVKRASRSSSYVPNAEAIAVLEHLRPILTKFYERHNPDKIKSIDNILAANGVDGLLIGAERLNESLKAVYGEDLNDFFMSASPTAAHAAASSLATTTLPQKAPLSRVASNRAAPHHVVPANAFDVSPTQHRAPPQRPMLTSKLPPPPPPPVAAPIPEPEPAAVLHFARALYDFAGTEPTDLSFKKGQVIELMDQSETWWRGRYPLPRGQEAKGSFPSNYVVEISEAEALEQKSLELHQNMTPVVAMRRQQSVMLSKRNLLLSSDPEPEEEVYPPEHIKEDLLLMHLFKAMSEIATSEYNYLRDLQIACAVYINPMNATFGVELSRSIFSVWSPELIRLHKKLLESMLETLPDPATIQIDFGSGTSAHRLSQMPARKSSMVGASTSDLFDAKTNEWMRTTCSKLDALESTYHQYLESGVGLTPQQRTARVDLLNKWAMDHSRRMVKEAPSLRLASDYIVNYNHAAELCESLTPTQLASIQAWEKSPHLKSLKLRDFLIKPVQRVCKYPLLFREVIKYAPSDEVKLEVEQAYKAVTVLANLVDNMLKQADNAVETKLGELRPLMRPRNEVEALGLNRVSCRLARQSEIGVLSVETFPERSNVHSSSLGPQLAPLKRGALLGLLFPNCLIIAQRYNNLMGKHRLQIAWVVKFAEYDSVEVRPLEHYTTTGNSSGWDTDGAAFTLELTDRATGASNWTLIVPAAKREGWVEDLQASDLQAREERKAQGKLAPEEATARAQEVRRSSVARRSVGASPTKEPFVPPSAGHGAPKPMERPVAIPTGVMNNAKSNAIIAEFQEQVRQREQRTQMV